MSVAFEAVLVLGDSWGMADRATGTVLTVGRVTAALLGSPREVTGGSVEQARAASEGRGSALALLYDDRVGLRRAVLFGGGKLLREFGPQDEEWVLLDEEGEPKRDGPRFSLATLPDGEEAECAVTALDQGLIALGLERDEARAVVSRLRAA